MKIDITLASTDDVPRPLDFRFFDYRGFLGTFECKHCFSPRARCYSTSLWCFISTITIFNFFSMIFNTSTHGEKNIFILYSRAKTCIAGFFKSLSNMHIITHRIQACFSTAVKLCICFIVKLQFLHMIFNTSQRAIKLNPAWDVLKIVCRNWNIIVMQIQHLTAVEKHLTSNEEWHCRHWKLTWQTL